MTLARRLAASGLVALVALALANVTANAATKRVMPTPKPLPLPAKGRAAVQPPEIYQVNPTKVNPTVQPNVMIMGLHLTAATTVAVGGVPAQTVQAPDANHLLVKLPDNLSSGTYSVEVTNEAGSAIATDALVVDAGTQLSMLQYAAAGGFLILLVLVMRLARTPGL